MKAPPLSTVVGVAAMLFGGWWIWDTLYQPVVRFFTDEKKPQDYFFLLVLPALSLPGIIAALFGFRLTRQKAPRNYKGVIGAFSIFAVFGSLITSSEPSRCRCMRKSKTLFPRFWRLS